MLRILSIIILAAQCLFAKEEDLKHLFSASLKESIQASKRVQTKRYQYWTDNYQRALKMAKEKQLYLLMAFMGSDWCPWSQKLESEVLTQSEFIKGLKEQVIFVWVDFPENARLSDERKETNKQLKEKYNVQELPTLILIDETGEKITKLGYLPFNAQEFLSHLKEYIVEYRELKNTLDTHELTQLDSGRIKQLYETVKKMGCDQYKDQLLQAGLKADKETFFLLEKYANLLEMTKLKDPQVLELRKAIVSRDPSNQKMTHLRLAMLDFHKMSSFPRKREDAYTDIEPLVSYVKEFGARDCDNLWRVEMTIAQYLFSKGNVSKALQHATASYNSAPDDLKSEIAQSIDYLKSQNPLP